MVNYEFKGSGSFGCVISPALPCTGDKKRKVNDKSNNTENTKYDTLVSKVFYRKNLAQHEFDIQHLLSNIDPDQKYVIIPRKLCSTDISMLPSDVFSKCEFDDMTTNNTFVSNEEKYADETINSRHKYKSSKDKLLTPYDGIYDMRMKKKQIIYDNGGSSLKTIFDNYPTLMFEELLPYLLNVIEGIIRLQKHSIVHMDIKPGNIVFNPQMKNKELRIIDFGLFEYIPKIKEIILNNNKRVGTTFWRRVTKFKYVYYPIDFLMLTYLFNKRLQVKKRFDLIKQALETKSKLPRYHFIYNFTLKKLVEHHFRYFKFFADNPDKALNVFVNELPEKIDIYSLGVTIFELYYTAQQKERFNNPFWCEEHVLPLIQKLIHPILFERLNAKNAFKEWQTLVQKIKKQK